MTTKAMPSGAIWRTLFLVLILAASGCETQGLKLVSPPPGSLNPVPVEARLEPAMMTRQDFMVSGEHQPPAPLPQALGLPWLDKGDVGRLCEEYLRDAKVFRELPVLPLWDPPELVLMLQPVVTFRQYIEPSVSGTIMSLGTAGIFNILGGSANDRTAECQVTILARDRNGRLIQSYSASARSGKKLVTTGADQLGPLFSEAFTKALEQVTRQISGEHDLLMRALPLTPKGVEILDRSKRILVLSPKSTIVSESSFTIRGQVTGLADDEPVELIWSAGKEASGKKLHLRDSKTPSVKVFTLAPPIGKTKKPITITFTLRSKPGGDQPATKLAQIQRSYVVRLQDAPPIRQRWAVIVGISEYGKDVLRLPKLEFAHRDADRLRSFLLSPEGGDFQHVMCLTNKQATAGKVREAMFEFLAGAGKDDLVVIYFSGHGLTRPGARAENHFLLCYDTDLKNNHLPSTSFPMWDVDTALAKFIKAERVVVFADACYSGAITRKGGLRPKGDQDNLLVEYLQKLAVTKPGRLILTASKAVEPSYESKEHQSGVFTHFLLEGLQGMADSDGNGFVSAEEIVAFVQAKVPEYVRKKLRNRKTQNPQEGGQYDARMPLSFTGAKRPAKRDKGSAAKPK